ncbi:MAG: hypothetical protein FJW64_13225 [Actinobacteria bacterium]|nr:hypothetical protein [Actinomycetota bacterium]
MPARDTGGGRGVGRRLRWAAPLAAVLVLATGTAAAQGLWERRVDVAVAPVTAGSLAITTAWVGTPPTWPPIFPGETRDTGLLRVSGTGAGTTLRWKVSATVTFGDGFAGHVTTQLYRGACGGTALPSAGYAPAGGYGPTDTVDLCLRMTLAPAAPSDLQGRSLVPTIHVVADQVTS